MFPKAVPSSWIVRSTASEGTSIADLLPFQFGIFDKDSHNALAAGTVANKRKVYFAVGSPNQRQFTQGSKPERLFNQNNSDVNFRTELVPTSKVETIRYQVPKKTENPNVYYLGYNGLGVCETLKFECGKTYMFNVEVKGRPVRNIFPGEMREIIEFTTDCCDTCDQTGCAVGEDCGKYIDALVDKFNSGLWVSRFFTASKVLKCAEEPEALTRTNFVKYCLTVCDNGDELALSKVQHAYPSNKVTVKSRKAPFTTYEIIKTAGLPSDFTQTNVVFTDECGDCPSGWTSVPAGDAYLVEVQASVWTTAFDTNNATTLETLLGTDAGDIVTDGSATLISNAADKLTFYVVVGNGTTVDVAASVDFGVSALSLGTKPATCTTSSTTTSWVACGTAYKVQRDLCVQVGSDNCDDPSATQAALLAEGQAFYNALDEIVDDTFLESSTTAPSGCVVQYTVSQYNTEFLEDDCDTSPNPVFRELTPFKGQPWKVCPCEGWTVNEDTGCPVPPAADDNCCQCGIKFETKPTTQLLDNFLGYDFATYLEKEPVELVVTVYRDDDQTRICDYTSPSWLHAKRATFRQLRGDDVIKRVITERFYNQEPWVNQTGKENILFLQREGIKLGVNIDDFYYAFDIYFNEERNVNNTAGHNNTRHCVTLFINENDVDAVASVKQLLASSFQDAELENWV